MNSEDIMIVQDSGQVGEPMSMDEVKRLRQEADAKMKEYKREKYVAKKAGNQGATDDMILNGRNLVIQESKQEAEREMNKIGSKDKEDYDRFYEAAQRKNEKQFTENPLRYIRTFGRPNEGVAADKLMELTAGHRDDEGAVKKQTVRGEATKTEDPDL